MLPSDSEHFSGEQPGTPGILGKLLLPDENEMEMDLIWSNTLGSSELTLGTKSSSSFVDTAYFARLQKPADVSLINTECVTLFVVGAGQGTARCV